MLWMDKIPFGNVGEGAGYIFPHLIMTHTTPRQTIGDLDYYYIDQQIKSVFPTSVYAYLSVILSISN